MPREETRWQCQTPHAGKKSSQHCSYSRLHNLKGLPCQNIFTQEGESLPNPQEIQIRILPIDGGPEPNHPQQKNDIGPCKILILSWKVTPEEKMLRMDSNSIKFPQKILGVSFSISFRDLLSPSPTVL